NTIQSSNEIQKYFMGLGFNDFIQETKDGKTYFHIPVSGIQKDILEANGLLTKKQKQPENVQHAPLQYNITFNTEADALKCVLRLNQSQDTRIRSCFKTGLGLQKFDSSFGFIINEEQYTALCKWAPHFIASGSLDQLAVDLQNKAALQFKPSIKPYSPP